VECFQPLADQADGRNGRTTGRIEPKASAMDHFSQRYDLLPSEHRILLARAYRAFETGTDHDPRQLGSDYRELSSRIHRHIDPVRVGRTRLRNRLIETFSKSARRMDGDDYLRPVA